METLKEILNFSLIEEHNGFLAIIIPKEFEQNLIEVSTDIYIFIIESETIESLRQYDLEIEKDNYFIDIICI